MAIPRTYKPGSQGWGKAASPRALEVYSWIFDRTAKTGYQPSLRETMRHFGIGCTNGIVCHIATLQKYGYIGRHSDVRSRSYIFLKTPDGEPFRGFIHKPEGK